MDLERFSAGPPEWDLVSTTVRTRTTGAVTATEYVPAVVGLPEIRPLPLIDSPAGKPVAEYVSDLPAESVAEICRVLIAEFCVDVWLPGFVTETVSVVGELTVHVNEVLPEAVPEEAVTVTVEVPVAVGVPVMAPELLIDRPAGSPVAE